MQAMTDTRPAPTREDLFGPVPSPRLPAAARPWRALARLLLRLGTPGPGAAEGIGALLDAVRAEIDAAAAPAGLVRAKPHPLLEAWLPRAAAPEPSLAELALLVEAIAAAPPAERAVWGRRLFLRHGGLAAEALVGLAEEEDALAPLLRSLLAEEELRAVTLRVLAAIPPARVEAALAQALPAMDGPARRAFAAAARGAAAEPARAA